MIFQALHKREQDKKPITVGLIGAGCMGKGIAHQISITPGMKLLWIADIDLETAKETAALAEETLYDTSAETLLTQYPVEVMVEATNTVKAALDYCECALKNGAHIVLMNAEVDLAYGSHLQKLADKKNLVVTSDAGDQHGVLATMIDEIQLWGFDIIQAGNIKGFLNKYATAAELKEEAEKRNLNPIQCCAYTDGTKLNIEMALLSNAYGYLPTENGMTGPKVNHVTEVLSNFDFTKVGVEGSVDYILGAEPGGGVYVVGKCENFIQQPYLQYYKLGDAPYYLFYRPYHLCHLETPVAIAKAALFNCAVLKPQGDLIADVYAMAKTDLSEGLKITHGIGSDEFYGIIANAKEAQIHGWVAIHRLEENLFELAKPLTKDSPLTQNHLIKK